jgi:hypothetical protein
MFSLTDLFKIFPLSESSSTRLVKLCPPPLFLACHFFLNHVIVLLVNVPPALYHRLLKRNKFYSFHVRIIMCHATWREAWGWGSLLQPSN